MGAFQRLTYAGIATSKLRAKVAREVRTMQTEEVADESRLSAASRYESLVGVSSAIGRHRNPRDLFSALVRELHRVVQFHYVGVSIRDERSNTFHRHSIDAETEAAVPPKSERSPLLVKLQISIPPKKFTFFRWWLSRSLSHSTMRCTLMQRKPPNRS